MPYEFFGNQFHQGLFNEFDLPFYGFRNNMLTDFGRFDDPFFGSSELQKFIQEGKPGVFQKSKTVEKHTRVENGQRRTITETKTTHPDGKVTHKVKEETDDGKGHHQVRYLDTVPEDFKKMIAPHAEDQKKIQSKPN